MYNIYSGLKDVFFLFTSSCLNCVLVRDSGGAVWWCCLVVLSGGDVWWCCLVVLSGGAV